MSEVPGKIDSALEAQRYVLDAWDNLSTRDYSRIMRKYGYLGDALNTLRNTVAAANKAIVTDAYAADDEEHGHHVPGKYFVLPPGYGYQLPVATTEDEWVDTGVEANCAVIGLGGEVTFYVATPDGLYTVITYPAGWYGPFKPVLLDPEKRYPAQEKTKRKKLSEMTPEEKHEAIQALRERLDAASDAADKVRVRLDDALESNQTQQGPTDTGVGLSATYTSKQTNEERAKIRAGLAKGELPTDDLGTDAGGVPIAPPERIKDVWGKGEPPPEPTGLPVTDEGHEAELARLRAESDRDFEPAPGLSGPQEFSPTPHADQSRPADLEDWHGEVQ